MDQFRQIIHEGRSRRVGKGKKERKKKKEREKVYQESNPVFPSVYPLKQCRHMDFLRCLKIKFQTFVKINVMIVTFTVEKTLPVLM